MKMRKTMKEEKKAKKMMKTMRKKILKMSDKLRIRELLQHLLLVKIRGHLIVGGSCHLMNTTKMMNMMKWMMRKMMEIEYKRYKR